MKILHIVPTYYPAHRYGGPIKSVHGLNAALVKEGVDVTVYTTNLDGDDVLDVPTGKEVLVDGVKIHYFPISFRPWEYSWPMHKALSKNTADFDLVHITSVFLSVSTLGAHYAKKFNKPYVISPRGNFMKEAIKYHGLIKRPYVAFIEKMNLRDASAIHFTAEVEREEYEKLNLPLQKAIIIPNGAEVEKIKSNISNLKNEFIKKFNINKNQKIVLFLSRISWKKGLDTLIPAFAKAIKEEPSVILVIAGGDEENYKSKIKSQILNLKIENRVVFTGMLSGDDKAAAYLSADVFVLPSYAENFAMVVAEAMLYGVPVVISEGVGISDIIKKENAGVVIKKDVEELSAAILKILRDKEEAKRIGNAGKKLAETKFSWEKIATKFADAYEEIIERRV